MSDTGIMRQEILMISRLSMPCLLVWNTIRQSVIRLSFSLRTTNTFPNAVPPRTRAAGALSG